MKKLIPVIAILGLFVAAPLAQAAAPQLVPVQGVLTDSTGTPIDTSVTAVFSIYTSEVGGTALWTETQSVLVEDGLFTAYMGDVTTLDLTLFRDNGDLWLGIQIGSDAEMDRVLLGSNPFAAYSEWCGNHPTPDFSDITGTVDPSDLPSSVVVGPLACTGTEKVTGVDSSGALVCGADVDTDTDTDTTYTAGTGLTLSGTVFSANTSVLQARVSATCAAGSSIRAISSTGTVTCEADDVGTGDITGVTAGTGLTGGGTSGTVTISADTTYLQRRVTGTCAAGSAIRVINSTGTVTCDSFQPTLSRVTESYSLAAGASVSSHEAVCPSGTQLMSGACHPYFNSGVIITNQYPNYTGNSWRCGFHNTTTSTRTVYTYVLCADY